MGFFATSRRMRRLLLCVPFLCTLIGVPSAALARMPHGGSGSGSGGIGIGIGGSGGGTSTGTGTDGTSRTPTTGSAPSTGANVVRLGGRVNASGDGITLTVAASGTQGHPLTISGDAPGSDAGATIYIEAARPNRTNWARVATAVISSGGTFSAAWTPSASTQVTLRAVLASPGATASGNANGSANGASGLPQGTAAAVSSDLATSPLTIPIFRDARSTLYGPGLWGRRTACGAPLQRTTLGVASRTLKCGTQVAVYYRGREITVPVIDRGPFANGASWDLTLATAKALGIRQTVTIGTLSPAPASAVAAHG